MHITKILINKIANWIIAYCQPNKLLNQCGDDGATTAVIRWSSKLYKLFIPFSRFGHFPTFYTPFILPNQKVDYTYTDFTLTFWYSLNWMHTSVCKKKKKKRAETMALFRNKYHIFLSLPFLLVIHLQKKRLKLTYT